MHVGMQMHLPVPPVTDTVPRPRPELQSIECTQHMHTRSITCHVMLSLSHPVGASDL